MSNTSYVDEIIEKEEDEICRHLLELYRELILDPQISSAEYSARLREVMDREVEDLNDENS